MGNPLKSPSAAKSKPFKVITSFHSRKQASQAISEPLRKGDLQISEKVLIKSYNVP